MQDIKLVKATANDIPLIAELAHITWNQHYPSIISQSQIDYMLNRMYSRESLSEQMGQKNHTFFLVKQSGVAVGFISVNPEKENEWFLGKFYINQDVAAKGIGAIAFGLLIETIRPKQITLTVNRQNYKSINFYFKMGFKIDHVADFDIGNGYVMNDFVMKFKDSF